MSKDEVNKREPEIASAVNALVIPTIERVREWHNAFNVPISKDINIRNDELNKLRIDLLEEELNELKEALRVKDSIEVLDALADLQYVLDGTFLSLGYGKLKHSAVNEVHRSNMTKLGEDGKPVYRSDGKVLKGPNYEKPRLMDLLV